MLLSVFILVYDLKMCRRLIIEQKQRRAARQTSYILFSRRRQNDFEKLTSKETAMKLNEKTLDLALIIGALISIAFALAANFTKTCEEMQDKAFRLHILANSDSSVDQQIKYDVRDYILDDLGFIFKSCETKDETAMLARRNLNLIGDRVNEYLKKINCEYKAVCTVEKCSFNTRKYGDYTLPAGEYDALKITLGKGEGHNWWCVLFPTICINAVSEEQSPLPRRALYESEKAKAALTYESLNTDIEYKFMVYEWLRSVFVGSENK